MLIHERMEKIKELIQQHKHLKVADLSRMLNVSEMTIHRDVKRLVEEGWVIKTFGGIALARREPTTPQMANSECVYCHRRIYERFSYRLILADNRIESACCCHCGLLRQSQLGDQVIQAICYDFLTHTTISVPSAWFVMDTSIDIRCCKPQVLPFESRSHADRFVKGFGGTVLSMREAMEQVQVQMKPSSGSCCRHD